MTLPPTHAHLTLPDLHPALQAYRAALEAVIKPAWLLRVRQPEEHVSRFVTHIGGNRPFAPADDGWPICQHCHEPLEFVWQIDFAEFGSVATPVNQGLFQFFYCWRCFPLPKDSFGISTRWYPTYYRADAMGIPQIDSPLDEASLRGLASPYLFDIQPFLSLPGKFAAENPMPREAQNEMIGDEGRLWAVYSFTPGLYLEETLLSRVGGYPPWVQWRDETPTCPACRQRAQFVAAIGSDETDLIWGDSGYWYFFACFATPECRGLAEPRHVLQFY